MWVDTDRQAGRQAGRQERGERGRRRGTGRKTNKSSSIFYMCMYVEWTQKRKERKHGGENLGVEGESESKQQKERLGGCQGAAA